MRRQGTKNPVNIRKEGPPCTYILQVLYYEGLQWDTNFTFLYHHHHHPQSPPPPPGPIFQNLIKSVKGRKKSPCNLVTNRRHLLVEYSSTCFCLILSFYALFLYLSRLLASSLQFTVVQTPWDFHQVFSQRHVTPLLCRRCKPITHNKHCARLFLSAYFFFHCTKCTQTLLYGGEIAFVARIIRSS
jgi:hypothetical protein